MMTMYLVEVRVKKQDILIGTKAARRDLAKEEGFSIYLSSSVRVCTVSCLIH